MVAPGELLLTIARCPNVEYCLSKPEADHRCGRIVRTQGKPLPEHQVPEPWTGDLERAPILFLSSNPSIREDEDFPRWGTPDESIAEFFERRNERIVDGIYYRRRDGRRSERWVPFWAAIRARAAELLGKDRREVRAGADYARAEVVHCKSRSEEGVKKALDTCADRYLRPVVERSGARVVLCLGKFAAEAVRRVFGIPEAAVIISGPIVVGARERYFVFLAHPNARKGPKRLPEAELGRLQEVLRRAEL